jgi:hypothetical protein
VLIKRKGRADVSPTRPCYTKSVAAALREFRALHRAFGAERQVCVAHRVGRLPFQGGEVDADEGGNFTFRPPYIRRQLGLRATLQRSLPSVSCTKRPHGHKAGVSGWSPISDSSAIPSKLAPRRKVRVRKADYAWSLGG